MRNLYACFRWKEDGSCLEWKGALLIVALDEDEAEKIFTEREDEAPIRVEVKLKKLNEEKSYILYDDYTR